MRKHGKAEERGKNARKGREGRLNGQLSLEAMLAFAVFLALLFVFISLQGRIAERARLGAELVSAKSTVQGEAFLANIFALDGKGAQFTIKQQSTGAGRLLRIEKGNSTATAEVIPNVYGKTVEQNTLEPA